MHHNNTAATESTSEQTVLSKKIKKQELTHGGRPGEGGRTRPRLGGALDR